VKKCTLPELAEMAARARIEYTQHVCPVHRIHEVKNYQIVGSDFAAIIAIPMPEDSQTEMP